MLTVNNKNQLARKVIGTSSIDAIGINKKNADQLSGADFDGDTVMCIPTDDPSGKVKISRKPPLKELEGFDPRLSYPEVPGMRYMKIGEKDSTQKEMGAISNLITDMTLLGAPDEEIAKAVRHSMVVIDAGKHKLNYKKSEKDNDIKSLKQKWQIKVKADGTMSVGDGASTLISRAKGQATVNKRQGTPKTNIKGTDWYDPTKPEGAKIYKDADDLYYPARSYNKESGKITYTTLDGKRLVYNVKDPDAAERYSPVMEKSPSSGKMQPKVMKDPTTGEMYFTNKAGDIRYRANKRTQASTQMEETDDAGTLISIMRSPKEVEYANYANSMKALANTARKEAYMTGDIEYSSTAKAIYAHEVASLNEKLKTALMNSPKERHAQRQAGAISQARQAADPTLKSKDLLKISTQALHRTRADVGSVSRKDRNIPITDKEWEAIQAGAISKTTLRQILANSDVDALRERAMPKATTSLSTAQINRIKAMSASNYTLEEIAKKMGKSPSTILKYIKGGKQ